MNSYLYGFGKDWIFPMVGFVLRKTAEIADIYVHPVSQGCVWYQVKNSKRDSAFNAHILRGETGHDR